MWNWKDKKQQTQTQQQVSAYEAKVIRNHFRSAIKWFEKYIEIAYPNNYPNWQNRKQIHADEIKRKDIIGKPDKTEKCLATALFGFEGETDPRLFRELKDDFYKWIDAVGIDVNNCPERLRHFLFGLHEILEGRGGKINRDAENRKNEIDVKSPEYAEQLNRTFSAMQIPLARAREEEQSMEGQNWEEGETNNNFNGNAERGKATFNLIAREIAPKHDNFHFWPQQGQQTRNPNYNPLTDDPAEEFLSSSSPAQSSSSSQSNNPYSTQNNYVEVSSERELTPEQLGVVQQVNQELSQVSNVPVNELVPVANGGLAFVLGLAGGIRWFKRRKAV